MSSLWVFFLGLAAVIAAWVWLGRSNSRDIEALAQALGLTVERGQDVVERERERGHWYARRVMHGEVAGHPVEVWSRTFSAHRLSRSTRHETVVRAPLARPSPQRLLLQPHVLGGLMDLGFGAPALPEVTLDDAELDTYFQVRCADASWARQVFDPAARAALLALRKAHAPMRQEVADFLTDATVLGALRIEPGFVEVAVRGTPQPALAPAIRGAIELVQALAQRTSAR